MQLKTVQSQRKTFSQEEAYQSSLAYFKGDDLAAQVWVNKYALKDSEGNIYEVVLRKSTPIHCLKKRFMILSSTLNILYLKAALWQV